MSRALVSLVLLAVLSACSPTPVTSCDTDAQCPQGRCRAGTCGPVCVEDSECTDGLACLAGVCAPRPECVQATDCAQGLTCSNGHCLCGSGAACASGQTCRQDQCVTACTSAADCAPGVDPRVASLLYACQDGGCLRTCLTDAMCGAGSVCEAGTCTQAPCTTQAQCPAGQYCTSATAGRCLEYQTCDSSAACGPNAECRTFPPSACPPGFDCATKLCQELPACLVDTDCAATAYCRDSHCQPGGACTDASPCAAGLTCVAQRCVPGGCRGQEECASGEACTDGVCRSAPEASQLVALAVSPKAATLGVGDHLTLSLVAFTLGGTSFPLAQGLFSVVDATGAASGAVTVSPSGQVTAVSDGQVRVRVQVEGAAVSPQEVTLNVLPSLNQGRRVTVVDATTRLPLAGVDVLGCEAPPLIGPCPAPVTVRTDARGVALFPDSSADTVSFSAASSEPRSDGLPRYDRVSVATTPARDVLLPLGENPVHAAAGFNASIGFSDVHSSGELWLGVSLLSVGDPSAVDLTTLLGDTFLVPLPGSSARVPAPGALVAEATLGLAGAVDLKPRSLGLGQAGRRTAVAFAGKFPLSLATSLRPTDVLATLGAMDFSLQAFTSIPQLPEVPDTTDIDGDGWCADTTRCAASEDVPDYDHFTGFSHRPRREQLLRTEVLLPPLPAGLDTAVVAAVEHAPEAGLVPLGLAARTGGAPQADGTRPLESVLLRSGAPYGGAEAGTPGVWAFATAAGSASAVSGRLLRASPLPTRVTLASWLPLPTATYTPADRTLTPSAERWSALAEAGVGLVRVTLTGTRGRHVVYLPLRATGEALGMPQAPGGSEPDPAQQPGVTLEVTALRLADGVTGEQLLDAAGVTLLDLAGVLEAYSRSRPP